jgi:hypothetical protein
MGRRIIWTSDLPDAKGNYNEVSDRDELQYVFVGLGGEVYQLEITEGEAQAFKKLVQKYVDAAEKAHSDSDPRVISEAFTTKEGFRSGSMKAAARSAFTPGGNKSSLTGAELAGKVAGLKFTDEIDGLPWAAENKLKPGDAVPESSKGLKSFVEAMGEDAGTTRIPNDSYWAAIEKAQEKGLVTKPGA